MTALPVDRIAHQASPVMVAMGDSNTVGLGPDGSWALHLSRVLGTTLTCTAVNGARARDVRNSQLPEALRGRPSLATILVGGNDALRGDFDPAEVHHHVAEMVQAFRRIGTVVLLITPPARLIQHVPLPPRLQRTMQDRLLQLRAAVATVGGPGHPLHLDSDAILGYAGSAALHVDRIHLSPLGHRLLALQAADLLACHGWEQYGTIGRPPAAPPPGYRIGWLAFQGIPWLARRSRDLLPELLRTSRQTSPSTERSSSMMAPLDR